MARILVTGATGFIGNHVVNELLKCNHEVIASSANEHKAASFAWFDKVRYRQFRMEEFVPTTDYYSYFDKPDSIIHLSWEGLPNYTESFHLTENLPRHQQFLENLLQHGLKDLTVAGTCFEYGIQQGCLREDMETKPCNPYAIAKDTLRKNIELQCASSGALFKWIRLFYMYGDGQNPKSLISQLEEALNEGRSVFNMSGGEQIRDFLPISEIANYITRIVCQNKITGIINCCSGQPVSVKEFILQYLNSKQKTIELNLGYYPYTTYEPMEFWGDNTKLISILNSYI